MLLIPSHGQATVKRGFSVNRQVMVENLKERSFIAQWTIHNHLSHIGGLDALVIDKQLLSAAASGRRKYTEYLERQRAKSAKGVKRKALSDEITALEKRQKTVQCAMVSMTTHADTLSKQAEAQNDMTLIMKSMHSAGLRRRNMRNMPRWQRKFAKLCKDMQM